MEIIDLETFVKAIEVGSLSETARQLHVSQPAISARIRRLEASLGGALLVRSGRGVRPTPMGRHLLDRSLPILSQIRQLVSEFEDEGPIRGRMVIGVTDLVAVHYLPTILRHLRQDHPALEIAVRVEGTAVLLEELERGDLDVSFATLPVGVEVFEVLPLYRDLQVVICSPNHPLSGKSRVDPHKLGDSAWILHKVESVTRQLVEGFFAAQGVAIRTEMEISSPEAIVELVRAELGLSVLPERSVERDLEDGRLAQIGVQGFDLERVSGLVWRRGRPLSRGARAIRDLVRPRD